jgi:hypothetical protein
MLCRGPSNMKSAPAESDLGMADVAVGEHHLVDTLFPAKALQRRFVDDWDAFGIVLARQRSRVAAPRDIRNLVSGEGNHLAVGIVAVDHVEIVKVAASRAHDDDSSRFLFAWHGRRLNQGGQ